MRKKRYIAPWHRDPAKLDEAAANDKTFAEALEGLRGKPAIYHCVSRIVNRERVLGREEQEQFVSFMRLYERFCQIRVLTFCIMSDHIHLLLEIPPPSDHGGAAWSDDDLLAHISMLYTEPQMAEIRWELNNYRTQGDNEGATALRQRYLDRIGGLSHFMKILKQRFTSWFNRRHRRKGYLWEERYKNVLVEDGHAALTMAAYIDLNPIRAGLVEDPKDYRWSGYGEAVAGRDSARAGLRRLLADKLEGTGREDTPWREVVRHYRAILFADGETGKGRGRLSREDVSRVLEQGGELSEGALLLCRARHLSDGLVFGSEEFVNKVFRLSRDYFGPARQTGARKLRGVQTNLRSMRDLQRDPLSAD